MEKKTLSIRVSDIALDKLQQLYYLEEERKKKYNESTLTKGEILEEAIDNYYAMKLDIDRLLFVYI